MVAVLAMGLPAFTAWATEPSASPELGSIAAPATPITADNFDQLAALVDSYRSQNRLNEAEALAARLYEWARQEYGEYHKRSFWAWNRGAAIRKEKADPIRPFRPRFVEMIRTRDAGRREQALELGKALLEDYRTHFGPKSIHVADILHAIGLIQTQLHDYAGAVASMKQAVAITQAALGADDYRVIEGMQEIKSRQAMARMSPADRQKVIAAVWERTQLKESWERGEYEAALSSLLKSQKLLNGVVNEENSESIVTREWGILVYLRLGRFAEAEVAGRKSLDLRLRVYGEANPSTLLVMNHLARLYDRTGAPDKALELFERSAAVSAKIWGENSLEHAHYSHNLADRYRKSISAKRALPLLQKVVEIYGETVGWRHRDYASGLTSLGRVYIDLGEHEKAIEALQRSLRITRVVNKISPRHAQRLNLLAGLFARSRKFDEAEQVAREAVEISRQVLGDQHPEHVTCLQNLAFMRIARGNLVEAEPPARQSLLALRRLLDETFSVISESRQLAMTMRADTALGAYLSAVLRPDADGEAIYVNVMSWKGAVFMQQVESRLAASSPELRTGFAALRRVNGELATLTLGSSTSGSASGRAMALRKLRAQKDELESDLAIRSDQFRRSRRVTTVEDVRRSVGDRTAFVDFLQYHHSRPATTDPG
ncbi:MAG: tetratricopeptide repeat protein, partial [Phycisphaerae bacterium]|nr:tetratricopeptide repeat protein [Phycisphaerae bacterium]